MVWYIIVLFWKNMFAYIFIVYIKIIQHNYSILPVNSVHSTYNVCWVQYFKSGSSYSLYLKFLSWNLVLVMDSNQWMETINSSLSFCQKLTPSFLFRLLCLQLVAWTGLHTPLEGSTPRPMAMGRSICPLIGKKTIKRHLRAKQFQLGNVGAHGKLVNFIVTIHTSYRSVSISSYT